MTGKFVFNDGNHKLHTLLMGNDKRCKVHKKGYGRKNITLICVTRRIIQAALNFKQKIR